MPLKLHTIIASTRPGRVGPSIANWFHEAAKAHGKFDAELIDLADFHLPVFDEPEHPSQQKYQHEHTKKWSASVKAADAFVFVAPEYNFGPTPALLNALDYLYVEWNYKPAGFVSYGGISGGLRAVQMTKLTLTTLKMMPIYEAVTIPNFAQHLGEQQKFTPTPSHEKQATGLLNELLRWAEALKPMRG